MIRGISLLYLSNCIYPKKSKRPWPKTIALRKILKKAIPYSMEKL